MFVSTLLVSSVQHTAHSVNEGRRKISAIYSLFLDQKIQVPNQIAVFVLDQSGL
jgi:hypothetical protein